MFRPPQSRHQGGIHKGIQVEQFLLRMCASLTEFAGLVCLFIYLHDNDLVDVEICRTNVTNKCWLLIVRTSGSNTV